MRSSCRLGIRVTSFIKPKIHNVLQCCQKSTESQRQITRTENLVNLDTWFLRYASGQAHIQTQWSQYSHPFWEQSNYKQTITLTLSIIYTCMCDIKLYCIHNWNNVLHRTYGTLQNVKSTIFKIVITMWQTCTQKQQVLRFLSTFVTSGSFGVFMLYSSKPSAFIFSCKNRPNFSKKY